MTILVNLIYFRKVKQIHFIALTRKESPLYSKRSAIQFYYELAFKESKILVAILLSLILILLSIFNPTPCFKLISLW